MLNIVVGAGFSGVVIANLIANKRNEKVIVLDKKNHIAGNCYDYKDENGIMIHKYGCHIFHTKSEKVWNYLNQFCDFNTYTHKVVGMIDGNEIPIPFNLNSLYIAFPKSTALRLEEKLLDKFAYNTKVPILEFQKQDDKDLKYLADYVYQKVFLNYTTKQWGISPEKLDSSVMSRVPVFVSKDDRYFQDKYQGIPLKGYTDLIKNILTHKNITVYLNTDFTEFKNENKDLIQKSRIFYTGSIDEFYDYEFGILPYRSVNFKLETHNTNFYQSHAQVNYPNNYDFTRILEYKYFLNDKSDKTVIAKEYSEDFELGKNERFYPVELKSNIDLYNKYLNKSKEQKNLYFLGRLGAYKYYNMDLAILNAINLFESICL